MTPEWDQRLHVLRDTDYPILTDISVASPPISGIIYLHTLHPMGLFHIMLLIICVVYSGTSYVVLYSNCVIVVCS